MEEVLSNMKQKLQKFLEEVKDKDGEEYDNIVDKYDEELNKYTISELMEMMNIVLHNIKDKAYKEDFKETLRSYIISYLIG
ncbi:MAG: hypothetical protein KBG82_06970 [Spirochaetes bacterium]|nr:hypothetical protein [Spirochaetota bacterium]